jgi:hypothetical protein
MAPDDFARTAANHLPKDLQTPEALFSLIDTCFGEGLLTRRGHAAAPAARVGAL